MYFNDSKEDTNIDSEFEDGKLIDFGKLKLPLIIIGIIILIIIIIVLVTKNRKSYYIHLNGELEMSICQGNSYEEPGFTAFDDKKNNLKDKVSTSGSVNSNVVGTYVITYSLNNIKTTRTIKVVEPVTYIYLNGSKRVVTKLGKSFTDPGVTATDTCDGNITSKVKKSGTVNIKEKGIYTITYTVTNSKGKTTTETRTVVVE